MTPADIDFMRLALAEARLAAERGEVPVGAVLVLNGQVKMHPLLDLKKHTMDLNLSIVALLPMF